MKNVKFLSTLLLTSLTFNAINSKARRHLIYDDFFAFDALEDMVNEMQEQENFSRLESKEDNQITKEAHKNLSKIKPEISHDDNNVYIKFQVENLDKNAIDIQIEDNKLHGIIPTKDGKIEISISNNYLETSKRIDIKKEEKDAKSDKTQTIMHYGSLSTTVERLPQSVDLSTVKADTKDNQLTITFGRKKHTKIHVSESK